MVLKGSVNFGPRGSTALGFGGHAHRAFPFDKQSQTIVNSIIDGVWYSAEYHYKKSHTGDFYLYKSIERNGNSETMTEY
jgi:hypothetical protein